MDKDNLDEGKLIEQAKSDPDVFGQLYEMHVEKIFNYIYYRVGNRHDAEDLTAKVFYRALNHLPRYNHKGSPFAAWLYRIAHNLVANWHRDHSRRQMVAIDNLALQGDHRHTPHHAAERTDEAEILLEAIQQLPAERQKLLTLKFIERMSNAEIGRLMGRSEGAIKSLYHRTLVSLRDLLTEHENLVKELEDAGEM